MDATSRHQLLHPVKMEDFDPMVLDEPTQIAQMS
jgi:hypothetical protein